jgi:hypothetical protein
MPRHFHFLNALLQGLYLNCQLKLLCLRYPCLCCIKPSNVLFFSFGTFFRF